jgi:hypothetical protein
MTKTELPPPAFRLKWKNGAYYVSEPNIGDTDCFTREQLLASLAPLEAELERMRMDAARYRWLRVQHWSKAPLCAVADPKKAVKLGHDCLSMDRLDAAIDSAMNTKGGERMKFPAHYRLVKHFDGRFALRRGWVFHDYADLRCHGFWWFRSSKFFDACLGTEAEVRRYFGQYLRPLVAVENLSARATGAHHE